MTDSRISYGYWTKLFEEVGKIAGFRVTKVHSLGVTSEVSLLPKYEYYTYSTGNKCLLSS